MRRGALWRVVAASAAVAALAACSAKSDDTGGGPPSTSTAGAPAPGNGVLNGLKGTAPLTDVPDAVRAELAAVDPTIGTEASAAVRPYDAVVVLALAAEEARTDTPARVAAHVIDVTRSGTRCTTYSSCRHLTDALADVDDEGASGGLSLGPDGQSTDTSYGVYEFDAHDLLSKVSNESAEVSPTADVVTTPDPTLGPRGDGVLRIGMAFPTSGAQAVAGAAARAGVRAAVADVNASGGVVGRPVQLVDGDTGDGSAGPTAAAAATLLQGGVDAVIGGLGTTDTTALLDPITSAGVVLVAPGTLTTSDPAALSGFFFRLSPPDTAQGAVLADVVANDGITRVTVLDQSGPVDGGMALTFQSGFTTRGGSVAATIGFGPGDSPAAVIDRAAAQPTNGYVLLGDPATVSRLLAELASRDLGPTKVATYVSNIDDALANLTG